MKYLRAKLWRSFGIGVSGLAGTAVLMWLCGCVPIQVMEFTRATPVKHTPPCWCTKGAHRVDSAAVIGWVNDFNNPLLNDLANEAVSNNFSLQASLTRVFQAEERARVVRSNLFPQFNYDKSTTRSQTIAARGQVQSRRHSKELRMNWEVDLWKRLHDLKEAQVLAMDAQYHAYQAARLSLVARVMSAAFELIESQGQIELANQNLESLQTNLDILDIRLEAGAADERTPLDITLSRADIARTRAQLIAEQRDRDLARRSLEILLGRYPKGLIEGIRTLPDPKANIPIGLPSDLLMRRPDILEGEMNINSALYDLSATRKQLLPSFNLNGDVGTNSNDSILDLFNIENLVWSMTRSITQPVFEGGRIKAEISLAELERDELIHNYADLVLTAFSEVESALASERYFIQQIEALEQNVSEAQIGVDLSLDDYEQGIIDIITLLGAQQRLFDARSTLLNIRLQRILNRVDLYLALGGDFKHQATCVAVPVEEANKNHRLLERLKAPKRPSGDHLEGHSGH